MLWVVLGLLAGLLLLACTFSVVCLAFQGMPPRSMSVEEMVALCRGLRGWTLVERAQHAVHAAMPDYGYCNGFDLPRLALARGRGYCWHRASVLRQVLRALGVEVRMVHAWLNRFEGFVSGHVWLMVTVDGQEQAVCPGDPANAPGVVHFEPITAVRRWGPGVLALSYLGTPIVNVFAFVVHVVRHGRPRTFGQPRPWRARLRRSGAWLLVPILAWNIALASRLPPLFTDDATVPAGLLLIESAGRAFAFGASFFLVIGLGRLAQRRGLVLFVVGGLAYFASWLLPLGDPTPSWLWLGPYLLPAAWLVGLGLMARSGGFVVGSLVFVAAHVGHGIFTLAAHLG